MMYMFDYVRLEKQKHQAMVEDIAFRGQGETHQLAFHNEEFDLFHG